MITVARTGPASAISAKKSRKAIAVHTTASATTDPTTVADGVSLGRLNAAIGMYASAVTPSATARTPSAGTPAR